jgi:hypothetical protein
MLLRAEASQDVGQCVVAFVAGIFIYRTGRTREGEFALPGLGEGGGIVDFEPIENCVGIEKAEALDDVKISVPTVHASGVPIKAAGVIEVRRIDHQRPAFPVPN